MIRMKWMGSDGEVWSVCSAIWNWYHVTMVGNMNILTGSPATTYHHMDLRRFLSEVPCHHITWQPSQYGLSTFFDPTKPNPGNLMSCMLSLARDTFEDTHIFKYSDDTHIIKYSDSSLWQLNMFEPHAVSKRFHQKVYRWQLPWLWGRLAARALLARWWPEKTMEKSGRVWMPGELGILWTQLYLFRNLKG